MHLKLKPEFVGHKIRRRPCPAPKEQADEIERQIQECIDAGLVLEYKDEDYPQHCSPCFLVAKPGSTPMILWGNLRPKPHLRYHTGSETAAVPKICRSNMNFCKFHYLNTFDSLAQKCGCVRTL